MHLSTLPIWYAPLSWLASFRRKTLAVCLAISGLSNVYSAGVPLAADGKALFPVVVSANATEESRASAATLAEYLGRISGATFAVEVGDGKTGIVVGCATDFSATAGGEKSSPPELARREEYVLRSHARGVWLLGATDLAVRHAVWDLLYRLGYRQFFPGKTWEVVPTARSLSVDVDSRERPAYHSRSIWYGFGAWDHAKEPYRDWCEKNRAIRGIELNTGHAYDGILARNKTVFAAHPEYLGLVKGERKSTKFCISNPALRQLVVEDALAHLAADPAKQSISIDPSDGGGWCECPECAKLGSVTDQALTLANTVAEAVTAKYPGKLVGMYAYNEHSPVPAIRAHPAVVVSVATGFIKGGYTVDQLLAGWSQKATQLGIREYYSVNTWDRDLPGAASGGNIEYLARTIPHFHTKSARFLSAESSDNWGPNGLGYYLAARMLWDVRAARQVEALTADFLERCFGPARGAMAKFYALLDGAKRQPLSDDLVGRMYRAIEDGRELVRSSPGAAQSTAESAPAILARLDDLTLYARYVELWLDYSAAEGANRQAAFEALIRHAYRMRGTMMVHTLALYRDLAHRDKAVTIPPDAQWNVPEGKNPWKSSATFTTEELDAFRRDGIERRKLLDFTPVSFSSDLVPATRLKLSSAKAGSMGIYSRAPRSYFTWVAKPPASFPLTVTAGIIYQTSGPAKVDLYPAAEVEGKSVDHLEVPPTREAQQLSIKTSHAGLHRIEIAGGGAAQTTWADGAFPMTVESSIERPGNFHGRWTLYFYVPRGSKVVGGFSQGVGTLRNASGAVAQKFSAKPEYFSVPVAKDEDGRLWMFEQCAGNKMLMTVPPFLARSAGELLLPREVVEKEVAAR